MKENTKKVFIAQPKEYGRRANENFTRVALYRNKVRNIYRLLGVEDLKVKVLEDGQLVKGILGSRFEAEQLIIDYGNQYFLDIYYTNTKDAILVKIRGEVPKPGQGDPVPGEVTAA